MCVQISLCATHLPGEHRRAKRVSESRRTHSSLLALLLTLIFFLYSQGAAVDIFALAHFLGWLGKALILRDYWLCWVSVTRFLSPFPHVMPRNSSARSLTCCSCRNV